MKMLTQRKQQDHHAHQRGCCERHKTGGHLHTYSCSHQQYKSNHFGRCSRWEVQMQNPVGIPWSPYATHSLQILAWPCYNDSVFYASFNGRGFGANKSYILQNMWSTSFVVLSHCKCLGCYLVSSYLSFVELLNTQRSSVIQNLKRLRCFWNF